MASFIVVQLTRQQWAVARMRLGSEDIYDHQFTCKSESAAVQFASMLGVAKKKADRKPRPMGQRKLPKPWHPQKRTNKAARQPARQRVDREPQGELR